MEPASISGFELLTIVAHPCIPLSLPVTLIHSWCHVTVYKKPFEHLPLNPSIIDAMLRLATARRNCPPQLRPPAATALERFAERGAKLEAIEPDGEMMIPAAFSPLDECT